MGAMKVNNNGGRNRNTSKLKVNEATVQLKQVVDFLMDENSKKKNSKIIKSSKIYLNRV